MTYRGDGAAVGIKRGGDSGIASAYKGVSEMWWREGVVGVVLESVGGSYRERNKLENLRLSPRAPAMRTSSLTKLEQTNEDGTLSKRWATARASDLVKEEVAKGSPVKKNGSEL